MKELKRSTLHTAFINLEEANDKDPREFFRWTLSGYKSFALRVIFEQLPFYMHFRWFFFFKVFGMVFRCMFFTYDIVLDGNLWRLLLLFDSVSSPPLPWQHYTIASKSCSSIDNSASSRSLMWSSSGSCRFPLIYFKKCITPFVTLCNVVLCHSVIYIFLIFLSAMNLVTGWKSSQCGSSLCWLESPWW